MKKISLVLLLLFITTFSFSQEINTLFKRDTSKAYIIGGYGELMGAATQLNNDWGLSFGVKGGMILNRHLGFGPIAKINIGLWEFQGNNLNFNDSANLELYMGSIGLFLEYHIKMENKIHFSIPVNIMIGGVTIKEDHGFTNNTAFNDESIKFTDVETSGIFIIEPEINLDFNVAKFFIPSFQVGYRAVFGSQLVNVTDSELSGIYVGIGLKFGKF